VNIIKITIQNYRDGSVYMFFNNFLKSDHGDNLNFFNFINKKDNHIQSILNKNLSSFLN